MEAEHGAAGLRLYLRWADMPPWCKTHLTHVTSPVLLAQMASKHLGAHSPLLTLTNDGTSNNQPNPKAFVGSFEPSPKPATSPHPANSAPTSTPLRRNDSPAGGVKEVDQLEVSVEPLKEVPQRRVKWDIEAKQQAEQTTNLGSLTPASATISLKSMTGEEGIVGAAISTSKQVRQASAALVSDQGSSRVDELKDGPSIIALDMGGDPDVTNEVHAATTVWVSGTALLVETAVHVKPEVEAVPRRKKRPHERSTESSAERSKDSQRVRERMPVASDIQLVNARNAKTKLQKKPQGRKKIRKPKPCAPTEISTLSTSMNTS